MAEEKVEGGRGRWSLVVALGSLVAAGSLGAQVGYPPNASPFHDTPQAALLNITAGFLGGSRGVVGVGPSNGTSLSFRYERPLSASLGAYLDVSDALTSRFIVDPTQDSATRTSGPVGANVGMVNLGLQLVLTGAKSWHGIVPIVGAFGGLAVGPKQTQDTSQYAFGTKAVFGPEVMFRWYIKRTTCITADARFAFWRLAYPLEFKDPAPDGSRVLGVNASTTEWVVHPWIGLGVGWLF